MKTLGIYYHCSALYPLEIPLLEKSICITVIMPDGDNYDIRLDSQA